jgi:hypothetical protein
MISIAIEMGIINISYVKKKNMKLISGFIPFIEKDLIFENKKEDRITFVDTLCKFLFLLRIY